MIWADILIILGAVAAIMFLIAGVVYAQYDDDIEELIGVCGFFIILLIILAIPLIAIDPGAGSTVGVITSIDKTITGRTIVYVKTSETTQEQYCVENKKIIDYAKDHIDKKVKIEYGERIGLYKMSKCHTAPIDKMTEIINEEEEDK